MVFFSKFCKLEIISFDTKEMAWSNVVPTVNIHTYIHGRRSCTFCELHQWFCLCSCIWITNIKPVAVAVARFYTIFIVYRTYHTYGPKLADGFIWFSFFLFVLYVHPFICSSIKMPFVILRLWTETVEVESNSCSLFCDV